jgi:phage terminase large subunit
VTDSHPELVEGRETEDTAGIRRVLVPYVPRKHFIPLHTSPKRFQFVVAHRRAGKTVAEFNHLLRAAWNNKRQHPPPRYAYVGPSFDQAKDLVWGYAKYYAGSIPGTQFGEGELTITLPNTAMIRLYGGAAAYERMRGVYFDGIVLDEFPMLNPTVFSSVVRPCLADYRGFGIVSGTSSGDDHFHALKKKNEENPNWDFHIIPVTSTDALSEEEVKDMTSDMSPEEFAREMLCSFDAPIEGSYYGDALNRLAASGRITKVPHDLSQPVITAWDLGIHDETCIWFYQVAGKEVHFIDYFQGSGKGLDYYANFINQRKLNKYSYKCHCLPHDIEARELGTGQSRRQVLSGLLDEPIIVAPLASPEDGINAARGLMGISWFDQVLTRAGVGALRAYQRSRVGRPLHNWASHASDAFRTFATSFHLVAGYSAHGSRSGALRRRIRGLV